MDTSLKRKLTGSSISDRHCIRVPTIVSTLTQGNRRVTYVTGGENNSAAILDNGTLLTWGSTALGKLGIGNDGSSNPTRCSPVVVKFTDPSIRVVQVSLGTLYFLFHQLIHNNAFIARLF